MPSQSVLAVPSSAPSVEEPPATLWARQALASPAELAAWLRDARERTLAVTSGLTAPQLLGPYRATVNPILWAMGHIAFFQETWAWRHWLGQPPLNAQAEHLYDSFAVEHPLRWELPLPDAGRTRAYLAQVLEAVLDRLPGRANDPEGTYFVRLSVLHEDMHGEAITYDRNTLGYPAPAALGQGNGAALPVEEGAPWPGDVEVPGHPAFALGAREDQPFIFDNEKWAHPVAVSAFRIARAPVTQGEYAEFVEQGGYREERFWSPQAWRWVKQTGLTHPGPWRRGPGGGWQVRHFDQWHALRPHHPMAYVSWYEAQAYCAWAGRRLPTEAEWELAASGATLARPEKRRYPWGAQAPGAERANLDALRMGTVPVSALPLGDSAHGCRQLLGNVWEWTADAFYPYPGFVVDPYREYSAPWFGYHKVLRGGCWATRARLVHNTWRNFFLPGRNDIIAGFRTCAL